MQYCWAADKPSNIGDLEFYDQTGNKIFPLSIKAPGTYPETLFDGLYGEDYMYEQKGSKVWMDFGKPVQLYRIRYIAHDIDPASVQTGDDYKLSVWNKGDWKELFTITATDKSILCPLHPGGMYLLENLNRFVHSRPFRYLPDKDVIEWW